MKKYHTQNQQKIISSNGSLSFSMNELYQATVDEMNAQDTTSEVGTLSCSRGFEGNEAFRRSEMVEISL